MTGPGAELLRHFADRLRVLILDNEVTVDAFVAAPPLPWARLVAAGGAYRVGAGYPTLLTAAWAAREARNWDRVSVPAIRAALGGLGAGVDLVAIGNNAGQGLALADAVPAPLRAQRGIVVYGAALPERAEYERLGYARFCPRGDLLALLDPDRPAALGFINTVEHDEASFHTPWRG